MTATRDTPTPAGLTPEQAHAYHERAGILEYDGHLPRPMAEAVALAGVRRKVGFDGYEFAGTNRNPRTQGILPR